MPFAGFVVNRVHPEAPETPSAEELAKALGRRPELERIPPGDVPAAVRPLLAAYQDLGILAEADRIQVMRIHQAAPHHPLAVVPIQDVDVHDILGLGILGGYLLPA
jgi:hypothetical protein